MSERATLADGRLNMRTAHGIYRTLQQFLEDADKDEYDDNVDMDFRSVSSSSYLATDGRGFCSAQGQARSC